MILGHSGELGELVSPQVCADLQEELTGERKERQHGGGIQQCLYVFEVEAPGNGHETVRQLGLNGLEVEGWLHWRHSALLWHLCVTGFCNLELQDGIQWMKSGCSGCQWCQW